MTSLNVDTVETERQRNDDAGSEEEDDPPCMADLQDPNLDTISIIMPTFQHDNQVVRLANALRDKDNISTVDIEFEFYDPLPVLNWNPLLEGIEGLQNLRKVVLNHTPGTNDADPLFRDRFFRDQLFPAIHRNPNIRSLELIEFEFAINDAVGFISFLDQTSNLAEVEFWYSFCTSDTDATSIASALSRNTNIEILVFSNCGVHRR